MGSGSRGDASVAQMRIALARLLLGPAGQSAASKDTGGLLLLDEPTNHLDNAAIKWLGNFLRTSGARLRDGVAGFCVLWPAAVGPQSPWGFGAPHHAPRVTAAATSAPALLGDASA